MNNIFKINILTESAEDFRKVLLRLKAKHNFEVEEKISSVLSIDFSIIPDKNNTEIQNNWLFYRLGEYYGTIQEFKR